MEQIIFVWNGKFVCPQNKVFNNRLSCGNRVKAFHNARLLSLLGHETGAAHKHLFRENSNPLEKLEPNEACL